MTKLIAFDLEGVLVKEEFLVELARAAGKEGEVKRITEEGLKGKIKWDDGLKKRVGLIKGLEYETVEKVAKNFTLNESCVEVLRDAKRSGFKTAIISGGFRIFAEEIAKELGIDFLISNDFVFEEGKIAGYRLFVNSNKGYWLRKFAEECKAEFTIAIGDGENDIDMLKASDFGILTKGRNLNIFKDALKNYK